MLFKTRLVLSTVVLKDENPVSTILVAPLVAVGRGRRPQVLAKPFPGQPGNLLRRPGLFKQCDASDLQAGVAGQLPHRPPVELNHLRVTFSRDEQDGLADPAGRVSRWRNTQ
jgi:hypothetical protein